MEEEFFRVFESWEPFATRGIIHKSIIGTTQVYITEINHRPDLFSLRLHTPFDYLDYNPEEYLAKSPQFAQNQSGFSLEKINQKEGQFYPRVYRPTIRSVKYENYLRIDQLKDFDYVNTPYFQIIDYSELYIPSLQQLSTLTERLVKVFNNVYPALRNFGTYGHEIRNLLILACTEVEAQFKGILKANGNPNDRHSMNDYIKLLPALRLNSYSLSLPFYPELKNISPFELWNQCPSPRTTLPWYADYHDVKHDNEKQFHKATLINVINAVGAIYILLIAQYGNRIPYSKELFGSFFQLNAAPEFSFNDCYIPPFYQCDWVQKPVF